MNEAELGDFGIRILLATASFYLAFVLAAAAHEIGHLLAATAAGLPVRLVT